VLLQQSGGSLLLSACVLVHSVYSHQLQHVSHAPPVHFLLESSRVSDMRLTSPPPHPTSHPASCSLHQLRGQGDLRDRGPAVRVAHHH
jgi:hypothetical protein